MKSDQEGGISFNHSKRIVRMQKWLIQPTHRDRVKHILGINDTQQQNINSETQEEASKNEWQTETLIETKFVSEVLPLLCVAHSSRRSIQYEMQYQHQFYPNIQIGATGGAEGNQNSQKLILVVWEAEDSVGLFIGVICQQALSINGTCSATIMTPSLYGSQSALFSSDTFLQAISRKVHEAIIDPCSDHMFEDSGSSQDGPIRGLQSKSFTKSKQSSESVRHVGHRKAKKFLWLQQKEMKNLSLGRRLTPKGLALAKKIGEMDSKIQVPLEVAAKANLLPSESLKYILHGIMQSISSGTSIQKDYLKKLKNMQPTLQTTNKRLFPATYAPRNPVDNESNERVALLSRSTASNMGSLPEHQDFFQEPILQTTQFDSIIGNSLESDSELESQNLVAISAPLRIKVDERVLQLEDKIRKQLQKEGLKPRSIREIATTFFVLLEDGRINERTTSEDLKHLKMNIGVNYNRVLHPLFMTEVRKYNPRISYSRSEDSSQSIRNPNSFSPRRNHHNYLEQIIHSIRANMTSDINTDSSGFSQIRLLSDISLQSFCRLVNQCSTQSIHRIILIKTSPTETVRVSVKCVRLEDCFHLVMEDCTHLYNIDDIFIRKNMLLTPQFLQEYLLSSKKTLLGLGDFENKILTVQQLSLGIHRGMVVKKKSWFSGFVRIEGEEGRSVVCLVKVCRLTGGEMVVKFSGLVTEARYDITQILNEPFRQD